MIPPGPNKKKSLAERINAFVSGTATPVIDPLTGEPVRAKGGTVIRNPITEDKIWESGTKKMRRSWLGSQGKIQRAIEAPMAAAGWVAGAPFRGTAGAVKSTLFGAKNTFGPYRGTRLQGIKGKAGDPRAWAEITPEEYAEIRSGSKRGKVTAGKIGGRSVFYKQRTRPGGVAGAIMKHPGKAAGLAALTYLLATSPTARSVGGAFIPAGPKQDLSPEMRARLAQQVRSGNPLQGSAWG